jgi:ribosomal protein S27E
MADQTPPILGTLTISKLKAVAAARGIDISSCKYKKDYVARLAASGLTEEDIRSALEGSGDRPVTATDAEMDDISDELHEIADRPTDAKDLPSAEDDEVERGIDQALLMKPSFFEIDSDNERAWNRMMMGDFPEAIALNKEAREKMISRLSVFHVYSAALSIRAAETLLASIANANGGEWDPDIKTALAEAKKAFIEGPPKRREDTLAEIEIISQRAYEAFVKKMGDSEVELRQILTEYSTFGVHTHEPHRLLEIAGQAKQSFNLLEYSKLVNEAKSHAERARHARVLAIDDQFEDVRTAIDAARDAGVDVSSDEKDLSKARKAFDAKEFRRATELLAAIELAVDSAHSTRVRERQVAVKEISEISESLAMSEPELEEAAMYGMNVQEGLLFVRGTKKALDEKDIVTASKLSRKVRRLTKSMEKELEQKRLEQGVLRHVDDVNCGKCGKPTLFSHPDGSQKCSECGHSFVISQDSPVELDDTSEDPRGEQPEKDATRKDDVKPQAALAKAPGDGKKRKGLFRRG